MAPVSTAGTDRVTARVVAAVALVAAAAVLLVTPPWHGPILFAVAEDRGLDLGDVGALGLVVLAARITRPVLVLRREQLGRLAGTDTAVAGLGLVLGLSGLLSLTGADARLGTAFDVLAPLAVVGAGAWVVVAATLDPLLWPSVVRTTVGRATVLLFAGLLVDAAATPSGTLFGIAALAGHLAVRSRRPVGTAVFSVATAVMLCMSGASLADIAGIDVAMSRSEGGAYRSAALVAVLVAATALERLGPAATPARS